MGFKYNDEELKFEFNPTDIICKDCEHRRYLHNGIYCEKYPSGKGKPEEIFSKKASCKFYNPSK